MITKLELIEYLKHTPENTNYNILYSSLYNGSNKEAVDEFIEVLSRGNLSLAALQPYLAKLYEDDKTISPEPLPPFSSGGSSVPKPLTYDYMPEGYPKKTMGIVTVMEEQELAFYSVDELYYTDTPNSFEIVVGETYTVKWDGTEYECVGVFNSSEDMYLLGNMSIQGAGYDDTGEPFLYTYYKDEVVYGNFGTRDTSASHTISVKRPEEIVTPMAYDYMPDGYPKKTMETVMVIEERELAFEPFDPLDSTDPYVAMIYDPSEIVVGEIYTVKWDGTEYDCVCFYHGSDAALGNPSVWGDGTDTGEPFLYICDKDPEDGSLTGTFATRDTSDIHTISIKRTEEIVTPMAEEFLPASTKNTTVFYFTNLTTPILSYADGTEATAQEAYDAFMNTRVLIFRNGTTYEAISMEWYDNNSAQTDPNNVGYVKLEIVGANTSGGAILIACEVGDPSLGSIVE